MVYQNPALRPYSDNGIRSAEEWLGHARSVLEGSNPRVRVMIGNAEISLYTRDQTKQRVSERGIVKSTPKEASV